jgi:hypothetical protein
MALCGAEFNSKERKVMEIIRRTDRRNVYTINRVHNKAWQVVKVLNMYDTEDECLQACADLICGKITEEEMLKDYIRKGQEELESLNLPSDTE